VIEQKLRVITVPLATEITSEAEYRTKILLNKTKKILKKIMAVARPAVLSAFIVSTAPLVICPGDDFFTVCLSIFSEQQTEQQMPIIKPDDVRLKEFKRNVIFKPKFPENDDGKEILAIYRTNNGEFDNVLVLRKPIALRQNEIAA